MTAHSHEQYLLGAYWGPRSDSLSECGTHLENSLKHLATASPLYARWFIKGQDLRVSNSEEVPVDRLVLEQALSGGRDNQATLPHNGEMGYRLSLWNGNADVDLAFSVTCGVNAARIAVLNSFFVDWPPFQDVDRAHNISSARLALRAIVDEWRPDWAMWGSRQMRQLQAPPPREPVLGVLTYLGKGRQVEEGIASNAVSIEPLGDGTLISATHSIDDPRLLVELRHLLKESSVLNPIGNRAG